MPIVTIVSGRKKLRYFVRWKTEWLETMRYISTVYRKNGNYINWKQAEEDGLLKGFPDVSLKFISRYWSTRNRDRSEQPLYIQDRVYSRERNKRERFLLKDVISKTSDRFLWTKDQLTILRSLVKMHRKSAKTIDWVELWRDPLRKKLPSCYTLESLRKYYNSIRHRDAMANTRNSLIWRKRNRKRYLEIQRRLRDKKRKTRNDFLYSKIETRK